VSKPLAPAPRGRAWGALVVFLALALLAFVAPRPGVDNAPASWFPEDAAGRPTYEALVKAFGGDEVLLIEVSGGDAPGLLQLTKAAEESLAQAPGVKRVLGPFDAFRSQVETLADPELGRGAERFVGWVFKGPLNKTMALYDHAAPRARVAAVLVPGSTTERLKLEPVVDAIRERAQREGRAFRVAGQPLVNVELDRAGAEIEQKAMPLLVGVCVVFLLLLTRSPRQTAALLVPVGLVVFASEGLLGLAGVTSNLIVTVVKPLSFVLLLATGAHLLVEQARLVAGGADWGLAAWASARVKRRACLLALGTTALGFGSLATSSVGPIRTFGALSASCLLLGAPALLILLPGILELVGLLPPQPKSEPTLEPGQEPSSEEPATGKPESGGKIGRLTARIMAGAERRPATWTLVGLIAISLGAWGATRLTSQPHAIRYLSPEHPIRLDYEALDAAGAPLAQVELLIRSQSAPITSEPALLRAVDSFVRQVETLPGTRGAVSLPLLLREAGYRAAKVDDFPADFQLAEIMERQGEVLDPFRAEGGRLLRVSLAIDTLGPEELQALEVGVVRAFQEQESLVQSGLSLEVTGSYPLLLATQDAVLSTLKQSLLITALLMQIVLVVALRSWRLGLAALIPNAFPVAAVLGTMALTGIPLDIGTSMAAAIALGVAVDDTLHVLCAWQAGQAAHAETGEDPLEHTARSAGAAILLSSLVVAAGFLAITGAPFSPTRNFGILCATAMLAALLGDLLLLPASLRLVGASRDSAQADATGS
jgi:uncharacterized protein